MKYLYKYKSTWYLKKLKVLLLWLPCCIALAGEAGLGGLWRRKTSLSTLERCLLLEVRGLISKLSLHSPCSDSPCASVSGPGPHGGCLAAHCKPPFRTMLRSGWSCCRGISVRTSFSRCSWSGEYRVKWTYMATGPSHKCSLWDLHRRNHSTALHGWAQHSLLPVHAHGPSCQVDQASTFYRQTTTY